MSLDDLAKIFHFSTYYFHRMFSAIVGKALAAFIRDRRLLRACAHLADTDDAILGIGLDAGYGSAQAFSRAFRESYGLSPGEYRRQGFRPVPAPIDEMIVKFTNRLRGGIDVHPRIIKRGALTVAGLSGDGDQTGAVWAAFEKLSAEKPLENPIDRNGYEVRLYDKGVSTVHVGLPVPNAAADLDGAYALCRLPASEYAVFDVYVASGYDSENSAMMEWLETNPQGYAERLLGETHYCVEYYDERFRGDEAGSIVEIWIPIEKR